MIFIRSLLFYIYFGLTTFLISTIGLPFAFSGKYLDEIGILWAHTALFGLRWICGIKMKVIGKENIPAAPFLVASKHQSVLETIAFWVIFKKPIYILKKELTKIPLYGIYLKRMGMIAIDRKSGHQSLKQIMKKSQQTFENNGKVIIFPEGTRTYPDQEVKYRAGVANIYENSQITVVPVALNTGHFWPSNKFLKNKGDFIIQILAPIGPGLNKVTFEMLLYNLIESQSQNLSLLVRLEKHI